MNRGRAAWILCAVDLTVLVFVIVIRGDTRSETDMTTVTSDLLRTTNDAVAPTSLGIWLRGGEVTQ